MPRVRFLDNAARGVGEYDQPYGDLREGVYAPPELTLEFMKDASVYPCPSATLVRTDAMRAVGGFERKFRLVKTDLVAWTKLTTNFSVHVDRSVLVRYRQHAQSSVASVRAAGTASDYEIAYLDWLLRYTEGLPRRVRSAIEPIACERLHYFAIQRALKQGHTSRIGWRLVVVPRLWGYRAFWRHGRWLRAMLAGGGSLRWKKP